MFVQRHVHINVIVRYIEHIFSIGPSGEALTPKSNSRLIVKPFGARDSKNTGSNQETPSSSILGRMILDLEVFDCRIARALKKLLLTTVQETSLHGRAELKTNRFNYL